MLMALIAHLIHISVAVFVGIVAFRTSNRRLIFMGLFGLILGAGLEYANTLARYNMDQLYVVYSPEFIMDISIANVPLLIPIGYFAYVGTVRMLALKVRESSSWHFGFFADVVIAIALATAFETMMILAGAWEWIAVSGFADGVPVAIGVASLFAVYLLCWFLGSTLDFLLTNTSRPDKTASS